MNIGIYKFSTQDNALGSNMERTGLLKEFAPQNK
jgi:hypothetical protein